MPRVIEILFDEFAKITLFYIHDDVTHKMKVIYGYVIYSSQKINIQQKTDYINKMRKKSGKIIVANNVNGLIYKTEVDDLEA